MTIFRVFLQVFAHCLFSQNFSRAEEQQLHPRHGKIPPGIFWETRIRWMKHPGTLWGSCGVLRAQNGSRVRHSSSRMECTIVVALALTRETLQKRGKLIKKVLEAAEEVIGLESAGK